MRRFLRPLLRSKVRRLGSLAALALGCAAISAPALAAQPLSVAIDHSARISIARAAGSVIVGNPAVADVTVVDAHTLFVSGRGYGTSEVVVLDALGRTVWQGDVVVTASGPGQVSIYRGSQVTEMACAGVCSPTMRSGGGKAGGSGGAGMGAGVVGGSGGSAPSPALPAPAGAPTVHPML